MDSIAVFGLGYVGKEVVSLALDRGMDVHAVDIDSDIVEEVVSEHAGSETPGVLYGTTSASDVISHVDLIILAVPTPLSSASTVDLEPLRSVCKNIASVMELMETPLPIVIESTIPPGTIPEVIVPIFSDQGLSVGEDVFLVHAPERIDPGNDEWKLRSLPRVLGAMTEEGKQTTVDFYSQLLEAEVHEVSSTRVAAAAKIIENAYRDINIAFVNEIALTLDHFDIDITEALDAAETKPFGFTRFSPGAGVGGHCIPIDPYFLIEKAENRGFANRFLKTAREVNNQMPRYVASKTIETIIQEGILPQTTTALMLGKAFKPGVDDTRNSPYYTIRSELEEFGVSIETYDPFLPDDSTVSSPYSKTDIVILVTNHPEFHDLDFPRFHELDVELFVDGRNVYSPHPVESAEITYVGVGR